MLSSHERVGPPHRARPLPRTSVALCLVVALLALVAAGIGAVSHDGDGPVPYTTVRGEVVEIYGRGIYVYDSVFKAAGNRGTDVVTLTLGIPLLVVTTLLAHRGSLRGRLLLPGVLGYFLYVYATLSVGTAYNDLFLVYVLLFAASLFAVVRSFTAVDRRTLAACVSPRLPRRAPAAFMFLAGGVTLAIWLIDPLSALLQGGAPALLGNDTTLVTHALDLAIIVPTAFLAGVLILRRAPAGYLIALALLVLIAMLAPVIAAQTLSQRAAGVSFTTAEIVGPISGFAFMGLGALLLIAVLLRTIAAERHPAVSPYAAGPTRSSRLP